MKKKISLILAFLMAATMLAGCKKTDEGNEGLPEVDSTTAMSELTQMTVEETTGEAAEGTAAETTVSESDETTTMSELTKMTNSETTTEVSTETETEAESSVTTTVSVTTATKTESITKVTVEWNETEISETLYVIEDCYSRKKAVVGAESVKKYKAGTKINIVAATDTGYYKLADGTYIHSDYVSDENPNETTVVTTKKKPVTTTEEITTPEEIVTEEKPAPSKPISSSYKVNYEDRYPYKQLSSSEQKLYAAIVEAAENFETEIMVPDGLGRDDVDKVYTILFNNEPQLFWLDTSIPVPLGGMLRMNYAIDSETAKDVQKEIDATVSEVMSVVAGYSGTISRYKAIYDWVITNNDFSLQGSFESCGVYDSLTGGGELQCQGYAKTFQYLCDVAGLDSMVVCGNNTEGSTHAWNVVYCDNGYYIVDTTWGDPATDYGNKSYIRYLFFLANDEMIENTHLNPGNPMRKSGTNIYLYDAPACTKTACYYFNAYDKVYDNEEDAFEGMKAEIKAAVKAGKNVAHIKVTDYDLWETMRSNEYWKKYQDYARSLDDDVDLLKRQTTLTEDVLVIQFDIVYK